MKRITTLAALATMAAMTTGAASALELVPDGGFESGNLSAFTLFPSAGTIMITNDASTGSFAADITTTGPIQNPLLKAFELGGPVPEGTEFNISFDAKGSTADGGVVFAEFFSEAASGTSKAEILGGAPLGLTDSYQTFNFMATAGNDTTRGVTLQIAAITGGAPNSFSSVQIDNLSVEVVPEPGSLALLGIGGLAMLRRRRHA